MCSKVKEALAICADDAVAALRITLIANAFLEAEIDRLSAVVSSGFARGKVRKAPTSKEIKDNLRLFSDVSADRSAAARERGGRT